MSNLKYTLRFNNYKKQIKKLKRFLRRNKQIKKEIINGNAKIKAEIHTYIDGNLLHCFPEYFIYYTNSDCEVRIVLW